METKQIRHENNPERVKRRQEIVADLVSNGRDYISACQDACDMEEKEEEEKTKFLGSRDDGETDLEHLQREADWMEQHSCPLCGDFSCNGDHEDSWYDYAEKAGILEGEGAW